MDRRLQLLNTALLVMVVALLSVLVYRQQVSEIGRFTPAGTAKYPWYALDSTTGQLCESAVLVEDRHHLPYSKELSGSPWVPTPKKDESKD